MGLLFLKILYVVTDLTGNKHFARKTFEDVESFCSETKGQYLLEDQGYI